MESSGDEEDKQLDSNGETSSSTLTAASEEEEGELTESSSILSDESHLNTSQYSRIVSSDEELFVSTFTRAEFLATYIHQNFSLPNPIMEYISKNPASLEVYQKLIQTCKYFFLKNPILVVPKLSLSYKDDGWYAKFNGKRILLNDVSSKFWVTGEICVSNFYEKSHDLLFFSNVTQKIFRCDNKSIDIYHQNISFNDFILLASKCECIKLYTSTVLEDDGSVVPCEKVFASLPLVDHFTYECFDKQMIPQIFTSETVEELIKIPHFATLKTLEMYVPHNFDLVRFDEFFKRNNEMTNIELLFCDPISGSMYPRHNLHEIA